MAEEFIYGKNPVLEALQSGRMVKEVLVSKQLNKQTEREIFRAVKRAKSVMKHVPVERLDRLVKGNHQGIVAVVASYTYVSVQHLLNVAKERDERPFLLILDELEDPHNLGAILRTADAAGVHGIIIPKRRAVGLTDTVAKTSAGAIEHVPVARVTNIVQTMKQLKEQDLWIVGTDGESTEDYRQLDGDIALAIVIGNEGRGLSRLTKETCDWLVHIPMLGSITSLNASVAASILMYEVFRKRNVLGE
ncbi:MAG TPA: 23S rRNA (guanosine(2251)-2'-O)-methyltransferase RlmB [Pseudogracilibacillus sp.]|nr:23S rRNA (guanosine(2251)-2'-O)-methyltransferase RlmB [Pseudogracilibacillus sp.]